MEGSIGLSAGKEAPRAKPAERKGSRCIRLAGSAVRVAEVTPKTIVRYLVDPASSHMLVPKIKPCMCKYKRLYGETAKGSLNQ